MPAAPTEPPRARPPRVRPGLRALAAVGLTALVVLGAAATTPWRANIPWHLLDRNSPGLPVIESSEAPSPSPSPPAAPPDPDGGAVLTIALLLAALVFAVLLALAARSILAAGRPTDAEPEGVDAGPGVAAPPLPALTTDELQDAVTRALSYLTDDASPHDAVIAAWVALEDAATRSGVPRDPAQTPTEFTSDVLHNTPAPGTHLDTLRGLYHRARFTAYPVTRDQVDSARTALEQIARALDTPDRP